MKGEWSSHRRVSSVWCVDLETRVLSFVGVVVRGDPVRMSGLSVGDSASSTQDLCKRVSFL